MSSRLTQKIVHDALSEATRGAERGSAAAAVLQQFIEASKTRSLLCAEPLFKSPSSDGNLPPFPRVTWQPQAVAALCYAMVFEYAFQDLVTAAVQLLQMFLPGYQKNQLQQSRRAMTVLIRSMRYCLTSEGEQAVITAVISLLALNVFVDGTAAVQALTKMALFGMGKQHHSPAGKLATWGVVNLAEQSSTYCHTVQQAGGHDVLVHGLAWEPLAALTVLASMAEHDSGPVWESLVKFSGLHTVVQEAQSLEIQSQSEVKQLALIIGALQKLLQHPHQQEVVLQQLKSSHALELLFVCAKANVAPVSQAAIDCLVLIWQWYLRKSPSASFSESQLSCFLGTDLSDVAAAQPRATSYSVKSNGLHAAHDIWRTSPHDSTASQIQSQPHKQQQQQQQASAALQLNTSQLWSVTPVVDFAVGSEEGSVKKPTEAVLTSGGVAQHAVHDSTPGRALQQPPAASDVNRWINHSTRRSSSLLRRSFDAWNGIFSSSHRSSTSAMASPYTRAQPSNASSARRSFASWRRPPKPAKLPTAVKPQPQASAYSTSAGSAAVLRAAGNTQAPHRSGSSLPVQLGPSVLPIIPSCLQTPVKAGDASQTRADPSWRPPHGMWSAQQGTASAQHAQQGTASAQHAQQDLMSTQEWQGQTLLAMKQQGSSQEESHSASASPAASLHTVKRRQPNALQCIQTWLDANPEGHWHPTGDQQGRPSQKPLPGSTHPPLGPASVKRTAAEIQEQQNAPAPLAAPSAKQGTPTVTNNAGTATAVSCDEAPVSTPSKQSEAAFLGPQTPEPRTPAQRVLTFSPMSVTQPGACIEAAMEGTPPVHKQVSPTAPTTPTKESSDAVWPERLDSNLKQSSSRSETMWEPPAIAWSASGSSMLTAQKLDSIATGVSSMGVSEPMTADNMSKVSYDSRPISSIISVEEAQSLQHKGRQAVSSPNNKLHHASRPTKVTGWKRIAAWFD